MIKTCDMCDNGFTDGEKITWVGQSRFKNIPSRVHFALSIPEDVLEVYHPECYQYLREGSVGSDEGEPN